MDNININLSFSNSIFHYIFDLAFEHGLTPEKFLQGLISVQVDDYMDCVDTTLAAVLSDLKDEATTTFPVWLLQEGYMSDAILLQETIEELTEDIELYKQYNELDELAVAAKTLEAARGEMYKLYVNYKQAIRDTETTGQTYIGALKSLLSYLAQRKRFFKVE